MAIKADVREDKRKKKVGFFEADVVAVNPNKAELQKLLGENADIKDEPKYLEDKEDSDTGKNVKQLNVVFWVRDVKSKELFTVRYFLKDKVKVNKNGDKTQYMNSQGASTWAENEDSLQGWFVKVGMDNIREAKEGEADFYNFVSKWLGKVDRKKDFELVFDWKALMKGNTNELKDLIGSSISTTVLLLATIRTVIGTNGEEDKQYQQIYNKEVGAGWLIKEVRLKKDLAGEFLDKALETKEKAKDDKNVKLSPLQRMVINMKDEEYGITDFYALTELKEYNPEENPVAAGADGQEDNGDPDY